MHKFNNIHVFCLDDSLFGHIRKQQITDLILIINENSMEITQKEYTKNVYAIIFAFFENLKNLTIAVSYTEDYIGIIKSYPSFSLYKLPPITFSSSTLTKLWITVNDFNDVRALLDGRLKELKIFIVQVDHIDNWISTTHHRVSSCRVLLTFFN
jgi:hypothetical protein